MTGITAALAEQKWETVRVGGLGARVRVAAECTTGSVSIVEHTLAPGFLGAPPHRHTREDETSLVLEGELTVQVGKTVRTVRPGEIIVKPRGELHTFWNAEAGPVRFLEIISPGGFESYFAELARIVPSRGAPNVEALCALAARYGVEFDLSGLPELMERHGVHLMEP